MKELAALLGDIGARDVETYIQSGNAVSQGEEASTVTLSNVFSVAEPSDEVDVT